MLPGEIGKQNKISRKFGQHIDSKPSGRCQNSYLYPSKMWGDESCGKIQCNGHSSSNNHCKIPIKMNMKSYYWFALLPGTVCRWRPVAEVMIWEPFRPGQPETEQPFWSESKPDTPAESSERKYYCRRPYRYFDGRQCRRTGFPSRLPLEITLNDYNNMTGKIFYPDPALTTEGSHEAVPPIRRYNNLCTVGQCSYFL